MMIRGEMRGLPAVKAPQSVALCGGDTRERCEMLGSDGELVGESRKRDDAPTWSGDDASSAG